MRMDMLGLGNSLRWMHRRRPWQLNRVVNTQSTWNHGWNTNAVHGRTARTVSRGESEGACAWLVSSQSVGEGRRRRQRRCPVSNMGRSHGKGVGLWTTSAIIAEMELRR